MIAYSDVDGSRAQGRRLALAAIERIEKLLPRLRECLTADEPRFPIWITDLTQVTESLGLLAAQDAALADIRQSGRNREERFRQARLDDRAAIGKRSKKR